MLNGWLVASQSAVFTMSYAPGGLYRMAQWISVLALLATLLIATRVPLKKAWQAIGPRVRAATTARPSGSNNWN
jgi:hypothetical protein